MTDLLSRPTVSEDLLTSSTASTTHIPAAVESTAGPYDYPYDLPTPAQSESVEESQMVAQIQSWSGWSNRRLAEIIGTTHPTIQSLRTGQVAPAASRNLENRRRLREVYELLSRLYLVAHRNVQLLGEVLHSGPPGETAIDHLMADRSSQAYLTAIRYFRPRRPSTLMTGTRPLPSSGRTFEPRRED